MIIMWIVEFQLFENELGERFKGRYSAKYLGDNVYSVSITDLTLWEAYSIGKIVQMQVQLNKINQLDKINNEKPSTTN
jgi:hypothetical protein